MKWLVMLLTAIGASFGAEAPVSFSRQIAPVLQEKCVTCHGAEKAKGGYRMHTFGALLKPGKSGEPAVTGGNPDSSELFKRLIASDADDRMPQEGEPLPSAQIDLIRRWIAEGAKLDAGSPEAPLAALSPVEHATAPEKYARPLPVLALAFDPASEHLAASGYNEITLWTLGGDLVRRIADVPTRVRGLAFHPSGAHLALVGGKPGRSGELIVIDLAAGTNEPSLVRAGDELLAVAFSPDGQLLAAGGADNAIHLFAWEGRRKLATIQQHADWVTSLSFDAEGKRLASASRDRTARIYEVATGNLVTTYPSHNAPVFAVSFATAEVAASGGKDRAVHLWRIDDGKRQHEIGGFGGEIQRMLVADGSLFVASADGMVRQHTVADRKLVRTFAAGSGPVYSLAIAPAPGLLAAGSFAGEVTIWNIKTGESHARFVPAPGLQLEAKR